MYIRICVYINSIVFILLSTYNGQYTYNTSQKQLDAARQETPAISIIALPWHVAVPVLI